MAAKVGKRSSAVSPSRSKLHDDTGAGTLRWRSARLIAGTTTSRCRLAVCSGCARSVSFQRPLLGPQNSSAGYLLARDLQRSGAAVLMGEGAPPDRGVLPDLLVAPRFEDAAAGIDTTREAVRALIAGWRPGPRPRLAPTN